MLKRLFASNKNPCFKEPAQWDTLNFDLSGCKFQISLPPQDYEWPEERSTSALNVFDEDLYEYEEGSDSNGYEIPNRGILRDSLFKRVWYSYGSIFKRGPHYAGSLQLAALVSDTSHLGIDCFNPNDLEKVVMNVMYYSDGPGSGSEHECPVNWQIKNQDNLDWVYFESWSKTPEWKTVPRPHSASQFTAWLFVPLFSNKYLHLVFYALGSNPPDASNCLMQERIAKIINTIKLQLSPIGNKQKVEAQARNPIAQYSKTRQPEPWKYYDTFRDGDILKGESEIVLEGKPSPPPKIN